MELECNVAQTVHSGSHLVVLQAANCAHPARPVRLLVAQALYVSLRICTGQVTIVTLTGLASHFALQRSSCREGVSHTLKLLVPRALDIATCFRWVVRSIVVDVDECGTKVPPVHRLRPAHTFQDVVRRKLAVQCCPQVLEMLSVRDATAGVFVQQPCGLPRAHILAVKLRGEIQQPPQRVDATENAFGQLLTRSVHPRNLPC
ncbi:conserved hypothetical protein, partial [Ricinus communis]